MPFPAFLDACALVPIRLTDLLLRLAEAGTYRPLWSDGVLTEVERTLVGRFELAPAKAKHRVETMRAVFPDALTTGYDSLIRDMTNDDKDRHVLAAAVRADADVIVTFNIRDFPQSALDPYAIDAVHPDDFLLDQLELYPGEVMCCLAEQVQAHKRPPETIGEFLAKFERTVPSFSREASRLLDLPLGFQFPRQQDKDD